jgi:hypothetical protein
VSCKQYEHSKLKKNRANICHERHFWFIMISKIPGVSISWNVTQHLKVMKNKSDFNTKHNFHSKFVSETILKNELDKKKMNAIPTAKNTWFCSFLTTANRKEKSASKVQYEFLAVVCHSAYDNCCSNFWKINYNAVMSHEYTTFSRNSSIKTPKARRQLLLTRIAREQRFQ